MVKLLPLRVGGTTICPHHPIGVKFILSVIFNSLAAKPWDDAVRLRTLNILLLYIIVLQFYYYVRAMTTIRQNTLAPLFGYLAEGLF